MADFLLAKKSHKYLSTLLQDVSNDILEFRADWSNFFSDLSAVGGAIEPAGDTRAQSLQNFAIFATSDAYSNFHEFSCILRDLASKNNRFPIRPAWKNNNNNP